MKVVGTASDPSGATYEARRTAFVPRFTHLIATASLHHVCNAGSER